MSGFDAFLKLRGPGSNCRPIAQEVLDQYERRVQPPLVDWWKQHGFCSYAQGFLWVTNPAELEKIVDIWHGERTRAVAVARSAFGELFLWDGDAVFVLRPDSGMTNRIAPSIDVLFNSSFCDDRYLDRGLSRKVFLKAQKRLGNLRHDECYAYEPALVLGGTGRLETLQKVKLVPHLILLAQIHASSTSE